MGMIWARIHIWTKSWGEKTLSVYMDSHTLIVLTHSLHRASKEKL